MQQKLTHAFLSAATLPLQAYDTRIDIGEDGKVRIAEVEPITVLEYSLSEGASVKTIVAKGKDRRTFRGGVGNYHQTRESAQAEVDAALAYAADNPPYDVLKRERDESRHLIRELGLKLRESGFGTDDDIDGSELINLINDYFGEIEAYLPPRPDTEHGNGENGENA
jgi:hypothetical protein